MMRISTLKTALHACIIALFLLAANATSGQSVIDFSILTTQNGNEVTAEVKASGITEIVSMQFTLQWDVTEMEFISAQNVNLTASGNNPGFGNTQVQNGILTFSWFDQPVSGLTLDDCTTLFSLTFQSVNGNVPPISITGNPLTIEITNLSGDFVDLTQSPTCSEYGTLNGKVYFDLNTNCLYDTDETDMAGWHLLIEGNGLTRYAATQNDGNYQIGLPAGTYDASIVLPNNGIWQACTPTQSVTIPTAGTAMQDFPVQSFLSCPSLTVDLSAPFLRRCFPSNYYVQYCNAGTTTAEDVYVEVAFDPFLEVVSSSIPWTTVNGNTYTFPIGDVEVGDCGNIAVEVLVSCDAVLGQTHCSNAHIYPDDPCVALNPSWDGSDLDITGTCDGDSVRFQIINTGDDMTEPLEFIVIEDDMIFLHGDAVLLSSMESIEVAVPANGSTWRVEMPETPNNPYSTFTADAVEGCGDDGSGSFSLGFVTQFPADDESPFIDEDCQENIGAYDPNDKTGYPKGFCAAHYIRASQDIEYRIRFQNTGTDTAFNIFIQDTLSAFLDPASVRPGSSSHPYEYDLSGNGVIRFSFPNIMLPDSNVNEPGSHGFVKFTVSQRPGNPAGTRIRNEAAIYFDFNEPIFTNTYTHTIGDSFVEMAGMSGDLSVSGNVTTWYDNQPLENVNMTMTNLCPVLTDAQGNYIFPNIDTADYTLSAHKVVDDPRDGVTVLDLIKMRRAIIALDPPLSLFQALAGDANGSFGVTTFDMVMLMKTIMGTDDNIDYQWKFVTPDATFQNLQTTYSYLPLNTDQTDQDFIAIKPGNIITENMVETSPLEPEFYYVPVQADGETVRIDVRVKNFTQMNGYQYGLSWDPGILTLTDIEPGAFVGNQLNWIQSPTPGHLINLWISFDNTTLTLDNDTTLYTLVFQTTAPSGTATLLQPDASMIPQQFIVEDCKLAIGNVSGTEVVVDNLNSVIDLESAGLQVTLSPNPLMEGQPVQMKIHAKSTGQFQIDIFNLQGNLLSSNGVPYPTGISQMALSNPLQKGMYLVHITDENGSSRTAKLMVH